MAPFYKKDFFANYFWSVSDGYLLPEETLVKTYLSNYFTFGDIVSLYLLAGKESLLEYTGELGVRDRVSKLVDKVERGLVDINYEAPITNTATENIAAGSLKT